jgi:Tol biopolymer transport system component
MGEALRLNPSPNEEERPRFSPDGPRIIFTSKATDPSQIWMCDFAASAGALSGKPASGHEHFDRKRAAASSPTNFR